jgi:hypothetical protein
MMTSSELSLKELGASFISLSGQCHPACHGLLGPGNIQ